MDRNFRRYIIGVSGASGIILAFKVAQRLLESSFHTFIHFVMTNDARCTAKEEMGKSFSDATSILAEFPLAVRDRLSIHTIRDFRAPIASGTYTTHGMVIVPCSMATLAAVSLGLSDNLLRRSADVIIKERRPLVIVPREAPFSSIHLKHMLSLSQLGVTIIAPQPAWYTHPKTIEDIEDHIVGRIIDTFHIDTGYKRWQGYINQDK